MGGEELSGGSQLPKTKCFLDETYQFQQNGFCVKTLYFFFSFGGGLYFSIVVPPD